jgi:nucleotide-binding universal stress UspA family protein
VRVLEEHRRVVAEDALNELLATLPRRLKPEALIVHGDPAEEAAKVVRDRHAGLVLMGLHGSPLLGPRMGSVTYRMLCLTSTLVLALPPKHADTADGDVQVPAGASGQSRS